MTGPSSSRTMTLLELTSLVGSLVQVSETADVWVTAEISDLSRRGGHCYMDLVQKGADGNTVARSRAVVWANNFFHIDAEFRQAAGQPLAAGIKVMLLVTASFHPAYGFSLIVSGINPEFTLGDMMRRRREIIARLTREGVIDMNRSLGWPRPCLRIAVVSAPGAAGYGDFIHQLFNNRPRLRFRPRLFPAVMQGLKAPRSIIAALDDIAMSADDFDCAVIIRGGGATDDLACFEDYDLAANIAQFPLPVIIGIGHERDVTLLDFVANMRVKTPTAAAEWLISRGNEALDTLSALASAIADNVRSAVAGCDVQLERLSALIPAAAARHTDRQHARLALDTATLASVTATRLRPASDWLDNTAKSLGSLTSRLIAAQNSRVSSLEKLAGALSPMATLRRGYTVTRRAGMTVTSAAALADGDLVETLFADGTTTSKIKKITHNETGK